MKLLFVIDNLGSGGAQRQMVNLACALAKRGHVVELFTYHPGNHYLSSLVDANIHVHHHQKQARFSIGPLRKLRYLVCKGEYDVVLSFLDTPNFYAEMAGLFIPKTKIVVSERSMYPSGGISVKLLIMQQFHRCADHITVNSHHQRERMCCEFPWMVKKITTIYNGYDLDEFSPQIIGGKVRDEICLLAISSVSFKKNSLNLARALQICHEVYKIRVHINWVGTNVVSGEGTRATQETNEFLAREGLSDRWTWLGERTDIPELLSRHDALIHPSFHEGLPNVVCEALACGRPVLASNVCDHPRLVGEGVTGYLFDPHSPEDIARVIWTFFKTDEPERKAMGAAARSFAEKNLSVSRYADEYEKLFSDLTGRRG